MMLSFFNNKKNLLTFIFFLTLFFLGYTIYDDYGISIDEDNTRINGFVSLKYLYDFFDTNYRFNLSFRKYLGTDCKTSKENVQLKQQLELMKMCNKVNRNPSLAQNENFYLLVSKCRGVVPEIDEIETMPTGSLWDELKDDYLKANPDSKSLDNNNSKLKMPPDGYILPIPKPKDD